MGRGHRLRVVGATFWVLSICLGTAGCGDDDNGKRSGDVQYSTLTYPGAGSGDSTFLTGVRGVSNSSDVYISGFFAPAGSTAGIAGLIYKGPLSGQGTWYSFTYPSSPGATVTSVGLYGPDNFGAGGISVVGNITTVEAGEFPIGALYQGPLDGSGTWQPITPPQSTATIAHSNMNGIAVGNYVITDGPGPGKAFIYDIEADTYYELVKPGAVSITAYGIWYNGGHSYTIAGGYAEIGIAAAYLVDWDSTTHQPSNWKSYRFKNQQQPVTLLSHFEGITTDGTGGYNLAADSLVVESGLVIDAALANVPRNRDGSFGDATWTTISYPNSTVTSANTVFAQSILGVYQLTGSSRSIGYVATVD